jgi:hypothetical protein
MAQAARERAKKLFSRSGMVEEIFALYESAGALLPLRS